MKMRAFSILITLVCIGFVLMLAGSTAHASSHTPAAGAGGAGDTIRLTLSGTIEPARAHYQKGDEVIVTFTLLQDDKPLGGVPLVLQGGSGVEILEVVPAATIFDTRASRPYNTADNRKDGVGAGESGVVPKPVEVGQVQFRMVVDDEKAPIEVVYEKLNYPRSIIPLYIKDRVREPVIVVLPPQETLYSVEAAPPREADGLLRDLPDGFDKTWLEDPSGLEDPPREGHLPTYTTWVADYCDTAERSLLRTDPQPQPIRLADGPRYHKDRPPANAQAYQNRVGNLFTAVVEIRDVEDLSAWQMDVAFNPEILKALRVREGKFLAKDDSDGWNPFFVPGLINNDVGVITGIAQARVGRQDRLTSPSPSGVATGDDMAGILFCIDFQVLEFAEESLGLHNVQLSDSNDRRIDYYTVVNPVVVTDQFPAVDVNRDRKVDILDLMAVAGAMTPPDPDGDGGRNLGRANPIFPRADVNDDGIINALDLIAVSSHASWSQHVAPRNARGVNSFVGPSAPALVGDPAALTPAAIQGWIDIAQVEDDGSAIFDLGIANLERLLQATVPERTRLLLNYPNPFNPETWIPYQLATATDVSVSIYSVNGALVRTLALGHQVAGVYQSKSRAAYWDGRNELGEQVASGVYFYTLTAGDFSATGKMLVRK